MWEKEKRKFSQSAGFEPALPEGNWFQVSRLNHSATTAGHIYMKHLCPFLSFSIKRWKYACHTSESWDIYNRTYCIISTSLITIRLVDRVGHRDWNFNISSDDHHPPITLISMFTVTFTSARGSWVTIYAELKSSLGKNSKELMSWTCIYRIESKLFIFRYSSRRR